MGMCCDLEVDVNGEATFLVDKRIILSFTGRLRKLTRSNTDLTRSLKIVLHGFPGGPQGFEQVAKFCYNGGKVEITPSNIVLLHYAANFLELECPNDSAETQLIAETKKSLQGLNFWSWSELLLALKQYQICASIRKDSFLVQKLLDSLIGRLGFTSYESTCSSFSTSSSFHSSDTRSHDSSTSKFTRTTWWFQDLVFLHIDMIQKLTKMMISRNLDHKIISKFLFFYRKSRSRHSELVQQQRITERVIDLLRLLDHQNSFSCEGLFDMYQAALSLKISRRSKHKLEVLMGSQLDQLTVSHLLIPAPYGKDYVYDVNLVLRLLKFFQIESKIFLSQLCKFEKVARLMDSYLMEVAPDSHLKASKFSALVMAMPHSRETHDKLYQAIDMYFQVHVELCEDEKIRICCALNYSKLSTETLKHLAQNPKFPCRRAVKSLISKQYNPIDLFCHTMINKVLRDSPFACTANGNAGKKRDESHESKGHSSREKSKRVF
ncbi:BTB/POZ domain-containing protein At3g22104-like [Benincasa hispida]|uniref:BTB/POZ domain-containing protein At3g22104-like n=1 Tax=Benincasa hispida TaxID=102211 RepID=UPI001901B540|nr:BTB/POZ domain-containing protein At3g22104-like [Benincasa hispida]